MGVGSAAAAAAEGAVRERRWAGAVCEHGGSADGCASPSCAYALAGVVVDRKQWQWRASGGQTHERI